MELNMMDFILKAKSKDREFYILQMAVNIQVISKKMKYLDLVNTNGRIINIIRDHGKIIK